LFRNRIVGFQLIAKYCATLKSFLQWSFENGYHQNAAAFTNIKTQIKRKSKNEIVALIEPELFLLLNTDLSVNPGLKMSGIYLLRMLYGFIAHALPILEKYNYTFPSISNQKFNLYPKEIDEIAELTTPVRIIRFTGTKEVQIRQPKFEFMSSHMARRTFVTIMLEKGVPITVVQKITQHSDIRMLMKYESHGENAIIESLKKT